MYFTDQMIERLIEKSEHRSKGDKASLDRSQIIAPIDSKPYTLNESFQEYYETFNGPARACDRLRIDDSSLKSDLHPQQRHIKRLIIRKIFFLWWYLICDLVRMFRMGCATFDDREHKKERRHTFAQAFLLMFSSYVGICIYGMLQAKDFSYSDFAEEVVAIIIICSGIAFVFFCIRFTLNRYSSRHPSYSGFLSIEKLKALICQYYKNDLPNTSKRLHKYYHPEKSSITFMEKTLFTTLDLQRNSSIKKSLQMNVLYVKDRHIPSFTIDSYWI